jgi:hypothetical protein
MVIRVRSCEEEFVRILSVSVCEEGCGASWVQDLKVEALDRATPRHHPILAFHSHGCPDALGDSKGHPAPDPITWCYLIANSSIEF